jgi:hypothetical protein
MTASNLFDYGADARDRLWDLLEQRSIGCRDRLKQSADAARAQLEWTKPSVMGSSKDDHRRSYAGPAVMAVPGSIFIVLAHRKKVLTIWLRPNACTLTEAVEWSVEYVSALGAGPISLDQTLPVIEDLVRKYGHLPGKHGVELAKTSTISASSACCLRRKPGPPEHTCSSYLKWPSPMASVPRWFVCSEKVASRD